ncbi:site-specific DNA-methyltransferase [Ruminococcaceae bacterium OttesenSCG-928-D13]|nr:site-specific DNA-methyltransferase [Ruminococcaceae bacterium OttesenSCG-928-D13]
MLELNRLYNMDCMEGMAQFPDKYFELAIVDPPFGIGNFVQATGRKRGAAVTWNDEIPSSNYFNELKRVSKEHIIWGANYYDGVNCCRGRGGAIVWIKHVPFGSHMSGAEIASYSRDKRIVVADIEWTNLSRKNAGIVSIHPCQKPIKLYKWLLKNYAKEGDKILDTHVGSASSLIACHDYGFSFIGFEIDPDYHRAATERLEAHRAQTTLFDFVGDGA